MSAHTHTRTHEQPNQHVIVCADVVHYYRHNKYKNTIYPCSHINQNGTKRAAYRIPTIRMNIIQLIKYKTCLLIIVNAVCIPDLFSMFGLHHILPLRPESIIQNFNYQEYSVYLLLDFFFLLFLFIGVV